MAAKINNRCGFMPEMIRSGGGVYEIKVGDDLLFSKKAKGRFPEESEEEIIIEEILRRLGK